MLHPKKILQTLIVFFAINVWQTKPTYPDILYYGSAVMTLPCVLSLYDTILKSTKSNYSPQKRFQILIEVLSDLSTIGFFGIKRLDPDEKNITKILSPAIATRIALSIASVLACLLEASENPTKALAIAKAEPYIFLASLLPGILSKIII